MKRIIMSVFTVLAVGALVGGVTYAAFTSNVTNEDNSFTAANGDITVSLDGDNNGNLKPFFDVEGMVPGDIVTRYIVVKNEGDMDMLFRTYLTDLTETEPGFRNQLKATITLNPDDADAPDVSGFTMYGAENTVLGIDIPLGSFWGVSNALNNVDAAFGTPNEPLKPDYAAVYKVEVELPLSVGNQWKGANIEADFQVDATQFKNQDPNNVIWN